MTVCAEPAPPHHPDAGDPAAEEAFYRAGLMRFSQIALDLAEEVVSPDTHPCDDHPPPTAAAKAEIVAGLARIFRRNARLARFLREPLRTAPYPPVHGRGPRLDPGPPDLSKISNAELEALARLEGLEPLEPLDRFTGPFAAFAGASDPAPPCLTAQAPQPVPAGRSLAAGVAPGLSRHADPDPAALVHPAPRPDTS